MRFSAGSTFRKWNHCMHDDSSRIPVAIVSFAAAFLTPFMVSSVNIALPSIGRDLSMGAVALSWVTTAYLLTSTVFLIPLGKIADTRGRKSMFLLGMIIVTVSSLLSALTNSGWLLILTRMLHGVGAAMGFGTAMAMLTSVFPPEKRGKMLGINVSFTYCGLMLGPVIGGFLTHRFGWRSIFFVTIPIGCAIAAIVPAAIKQEWKEKQQGRFDGFGAVLYGSSIALILIGFSQLTHRFGFWLVIMGVVTGVFFLFVESRAQVPILPISLLRRNRVFAFSNIAALINYSATFSIGFLMSLFLQYIKGMPPDRAGMLMIVQPIVMVVFSPLAGRLSDRIEPRVPASLGMGCIAVGLLLLASIGPGTPVLTIILIMTLFGFGFALFSSPNTSAVMGAVDRSLYGVASATVGTMRLLGQVVSMGFTMLLISIMIGEGKITPDRYPQFLKMMHLVCELFALVSGAGIAVSLVRGSVREGSRSTH
jgi:EmrB/QacA subfamily drug resistance transporter